MLNIISNAYKFTPIGGTITVSAVELGKDNESISYEVRVRDSGIGMSPEFVSRLFNAFERERSSTESKIEGTGLGMAITKSIVDMMGGSIDVDTAPGQGTEIIVRISFKTAEENELPEEDIVKSADVSTVAVADAGKAEAADADTVDFSGKRVLLVEDNPINMEIAKLILDQMGLAVDTAENGQKAVDIVAGSQPGHYHAVLMDIQMPVMDGYTATKTIRALENRELADVPILAMTANTFKEDVEAAAKAGMQGHIAKPIDIAELTASLKSVLS